MGTPLREIRYEIILIEKSEASLHIAVRVAKGSTTAFFLQCAEDEPGRRGGEAVVHAVAGAKMLPERSREAGHWPEDVAAFVKALPLAAVAEK